MKRENKAYQFRLDVIPEKGMSDEQIEKFTNTIREYIVAAMEAFGYQISSCEFTGKTDEKRVKEEDFTKNIIRFTEENVDGFCTDVSVDVGANFDLTAYHVKLLDKAIEELKEEWKGKFWTTDDIVREACDRVFGKDNYKFIVPKYGTIF